MKSLSNKNPLLILVLLIFGAGLGLIQNTQPAHALAYPSIGDSFGISPFLDFKTIHTEHFRVTFPKELEEVARKTAYYYEEAHRLLSPKLYWEPTKTVNVLVLDNADAANGLTSPVQRLGMVLFVTPPDNWFSTNYYDDWLRILVFHEYTHFLNMDTTRGVWDATRILFGDVFLPNVLLPGWMLEGLAVYYETRLTRAGRGRSAYYDMVLRTAVHEKVLNTSQHVTLDRLSLDYPYHPSGEIPYLFGYQLMNQVARDTATGKTADGDATLTSGDSALGEMSFRSGRRFPYFINGNLENITNEDWYQKWDRFISETQTRMNADIIKIEKQKITGGKPVTSGAFNASGATVSPDGKWLAYFFDGYDDRREVRLVDRNEGTEVSAFESRLGAKLSFSNDSKRIYFSGIIRKHSYSAWSELGVFDIASKKTRYLTDGARARDPSVSPDGRYLTFTRTAGVKTLLSISELHDHDSISEIEIGEFQDVFTPGELGRVSTPQWSQDSKKIVFSVKENGQIGEDLGQYDLASKETKILLHNNAYNRFPFYHQSKLLFLSDFTGVDNIYEFNGDRDPLLRTNVISGLNFPASSPDGAIYASQFYSKGWNIVQINLDNESLNDTLATVSTPPAPAVDELSTTEAQTVQTETTEYSPWASLAPRQWFPFLSYDSEGRGYYGGQLSSFDMVDRHRYFLAGAWDTSTRRVDSLFIYSNRSFGANITLLGYERTTDNFLSGKKSIAYTRQRRAEINAYFPYQFTWSTVVPEAALNIERDYYFAPATDGRTLVGKSPYIPSADAGLTFSNASGSRLAIAPEMGRRISVAARKYLDTDVHNMKYLVTYAEFLKIKDHLTITPNLRYSIVSRTNNRYLDANVRVEGSRQRLFNPLGGNSLDNLTLRGYPNRTYYARSVGQGSLDFRFPLSRFYRGWGTNPAALNYLYGVLFAEDLAFFGTRQSYHLPSAGGGARLTGTLLLHTDITFGLEYHKGFNQDFGGAGEVLVSLSLSASAF